VPKFGNVNKKIVAKIKSVLRGHWCLPFVMRVKE